MNEYAFVGTRLMIEYATRLANILISNEFNERYNKMGLFVEQEDRDVIMAESTSDLINELWTIQNTDTGDAYVSTLSDEVMARSIAIKKELKRRKTEKIL